MYLSTDYLFIFLLLCYFISGWVNIYVNKCTNIKMGIKDFHIMIKIFRLHLIICGFLIICLSLGGCSSSDVTNETSEDSAESTLNEEGDEYGEAEGDELELDEGSGEDGDDFAEEGLPEDAPLDSDDSLFPEEEGLPALSDEESGLPELPVAEGEELPALPADDQDQSQFTSETPSFDDGFDDSVSQEPQRIPVKKIKSYPYNRANMLVNAVYIARSGDDLQAISQRIYGADRIADLLAINPNLQRGVDVGDKVYYSSPSRSTDSQNLLFYYEDIGAGPQQYTVRSGENIRDIAQQLFGERESWKELWATNLEVESKWGLNEGVVLRYWGDAMPVASNEFVQEGVPPEQEVVQENIEPPPPEEQAPDLASATGNEFPQEAVPPPDFADNNEFQPPPPPPPSLEPPPPPIAQAQGNQPGQDGGAGSLLEDENSLVFLIVGVVVVMLMLMIAVRRKAKRRKMRMNMGDTQI